jgi:hypothetical protein
MKTPPKKLKKHGQKAVREKSNQLARQKGRGKILTIRRTAPRR